MKFIKSLILSTAFIATGAMAAEKITWVLPYGPGGGTDQVIQQLRPLIEARGHEVEVKYLKSCSQALDILHQNKPNTVLNANSNVFEPGNPDAQCVMDADKDGIVLFKGLNSNPLYFCTAPGKQMGVVGLSTGEHRVGVVSEMQLLKYVDYILTNLTREHDVKIVPYRGGGQIVRAARSGDIDLWFGGSQITVFDKDEISCFGASIKNDPRGYPFVGEITTKGDTLTEFSLINLLWVKEGMISPDVAESFSAAVNSPEFKKYLEEKKRDAVTSSNAELMKQLEELNVLFTSIPDIK